MTNRLPRLLRQRHGEWLAMTEQVQQDAARGLGVSPNLIIFPQEWGDNGG